MSSDFENFGMRFVRNQTVMREGLEEPETTFWFESDPELLALAEEVAADLSLDECVEADNCLSEPPQIVTGGNGVSGAAFVDNAELREWAFDTFEARVLDMESAAVAHVAHVNGVPFLAIRSLSDLAGGGGGENEMGTFMGLAATNSVSVLRAMLAAME